MMAKFKCEVCDYVYDEDKGCPENGNAPGTKFSDLPDDWKCPVCGVGKDMFKKIE
jgi:rubredoxin